jgi:predicted aldo/keto reductase-like oxidoreductase
MLYKEYGKTGKKISVVSFGGMRFSNPQDIDANAQVVLHAYRRGINYFDTAPEYCKDHSEDIFGAAIRRMDRKRIYISTKCADADGGKLRKSLERSLKRLNVQWIDFFHIWCIVHPHQWLERKKGGAVAAALKAKDEGLIRHLAVSSHLSGKDLRDLLAEGIFEGVTLGYCVLNFPYRQQAVDAAGRRRLGVMTMNPLGGGLIPRHAKRFDFIRASSDESVVAAAIRFNISQPAVTSALVGFKTTQHVDEAVAAVENLPKKPYPPAHLKAMRQKIVAAFNDFCTGCGYCLPCPAGVDTPRMMDTYNFRLLGADDQQLTNRLKWHWDLKPADALACTLCGACEERCTQHLPIRKRMRELQALAKGKAPRTAGG